MPRWPAWLLFAAAAACAYPAVTTDPQSPLGETYTARGQEPGWALTIGKDWIDYSGNYGDKRIRVPRPDPISTINGYLFQTERLDVQINFMRCNDTMSGHGYEHRVMVKADGETFHGCGGARRPDWDV